MAIPFIIFLVVLALTGSEDSWLKFSAIALIVFSVISALT